MSHVSHTLTIGKRGKKVAQCAMPKDAKLWLCDGFCGSFCVTAMHVQGEAGEREEKKFYSATINVFYRER